MFLMSLDSVDHCIGVLKIFANPPVIRNIAEVNALHFTADPFNRSTQVRLRKQTHRSRDAFFELLPIPPERGDGCGSGPQTTDRF